MKNPIKSFCESMRRKHEAAMLELMRRYKMDGEKCGGDIRFCNHLRDAGIWNHRGGAY